MSQEFSEGDRVTTPSGKVGAIVRPEWLMPCHELILLDDGTKRWVLRELLSPAPAKIDHIVGGCKMAAHSSRKTA
jgi:hypothetical protein